MQFRVHWLLILIPKDFRTAYIYNYDYYEHRYSFYRQRKGKLLDCFIIVRSSSKCWRVCYMNTRYKINTYFSCRYSSEVVKQMYDIYSTYRN